MIGRRGLLLCGAALGLAGATGKAQAGGQGALPPSPMPDVPALAEALSGAPHRPPRMPLHPPFANLDYDAHRGIRPRPGGAGGRALGGEIALDLMPPGFLFHDRVRVAEVADNIATEIGFSPDLFSFDPRYFGESPPQMPAGQAAGMGFAGLRLRGPLNAPGRMDELIVFQGASYFRALARNTLYGLSARALALGTGGPGPEEFPVLARFWLHRPAPGASAVRLEALLESPACTGALAMRLTPGAPTICDTTLRLFPRHEIAAAGIAPLTSMFWFGAQGRFGAQDFRAAVHDSDALWVMNGAGESLLRPLGNPARLEVSALTDTGPRAFGLLQTPRDFRDYQDAEGGYHRRPSAWVEPQGDWGAGAVTLVEIPTADEYHDNIVAFWRPDAPLRPRPGGHRFDYRLVWSGDLPGAPEGRPGWRVAQSRAGRDPDDAEQAIFVVDFAPHGGAPAPEGLRPELIVSGAGGQAAASGPTHAPLSGGAGMPGGLRTAFRLRPGTSGSAELRLVLRDAAGVAQSDVWLYRWTPARDGGI